ncbi:8-oxo-dGTP diphosphatase [Primorskyibacter sedentarius]|uniref:8-oxo-dGTP diphosphatase n=1 Tax=Primorskyibacter sedentarius TaxID=745311 RepID=A0A4V2UPJ4_9RHOB|nr:NUDIX hydrolase [Primorskyibacter sedentarius]TCS66196.1 8-oxo-dGTP diphosphatase [Primorskyibacter sedentarius]
MPDDTNFIGAKLIPFIGERLLVIRRDYTKGIPWPGFLDFPGGGREQDESPEVCALRETSEEVGLTLDSGDIVWRNMLERPSGRTWFFVARLPEGAEAQITFGDEGLGWGLMEPEEYLSRSDAIPHFRDQVAHYLATQKDA